MPLANVSFGAGDLIHRGYSAIDKSSRDAMEPSQVETPQDAVTAVTLWFRTNEKGEWMMNHLEDGHCPNDLPTPKVPSQKSVWSKGTWTKEYAWLNGDLSPKVLHSAQNKAAREMVTGQTS
jgi:hypothetical protein